MKQNPTGNSERCISGFMKWQQIHEKTILEGNPAGLHIIKGTLMWDTV